MKKNKLYTVNKWNKPAFMYDEGLYNPYDIGGFLQNLGGSKVGDGGGAIGSIMGGGKIVGSPIGGVANAVGGLVGNLGNSLLSNGLSSGAGSAINSVGSTVGGLVGNVNPVLGAAITAASGIISGGVNALWGEKVDQEALNAANEGTARLNNFTSDASTFDDVKGLTAEANVKNNIYEGGLFNDVSGKNEEIKKQRENALEFAQNSIINNVNNIASDQLSNAQREWHAYGGPLDSFGSGALGIMQNDKYLATIDKRSAAIGNRNASGLGAYTGGAKTFADGGLKSAFLDEFGSDPIGAAIRYNRGLEQMQAQKEAAAIEAQREADYIAMQQRLANLETQNQGLQSLMAAQTLPVLSEAPEEAPTSSSTPSAATRAKGSKNNTWDYVEGQLRKSGKFNDVQIEGIKYNLQRESALNPDIVGDGGAAFGLAQWHGSRQPKDKSLEGQTRHLIDTLSNFDGKEHWIGKQNYEGFMNARTPEEAHYWIAKGYERPRADIIEKVKRDSDMSLRRLNAFGGELGTNGTDFTNGLLYVDEGGTHEENPLEGVPMGLDPEGIPNLVEEGETVYNNYVFSDRMNVPDFMYKELGLGGVMKKKGKGMSFADASKKLAQESEKRPNDPISQAGLQASLSKLAEVQETERMKQQAEEYMGLEEYACGGKMKKYATGGKKGNKYEGPGSKTQRINIGAKMPSLDYTLPTLPDFETLTKISTLPASGKPSKFRSSNNPYGNTVDAEEDAFVPVTEEEAAALTRVAEGEPEAAWNYGDPETMQQVAAGTYQNPEMEDKETREEYNPYPTWMRYAPVAGLGAMTLTDALGITNRPDYTMANKIEAAAQRAGYAPDVRYNPIGDYMRYSPLDRQYYINQLMANSRATDRAALNTTSPSRNAALLANGYNTTLSLGNLARQAEEYNRAQYERTKEFNRRTNMFNSQMGLEAAMANARYRQAAQQLGLSGLGQAAALRDSIDARLGAAKAANLSNFLTSLGNIGRENFALNQINSDRSRQYGVYSNGVSEHRRSSKGKKGSRWT